MCGVNRHCATDGGGNVLMRRSTDSGRSWGDVTRAMPEYHTRHMCVETVIRLDSVRAKETADLNFSAGTTAVPS
jgi:hypothetical protein